MTPAPGSADAPRRLETRPRPRFDLSDLLPRIASGLVLIAMAISTAVADGIVFAVFWWLAAIVVLWEWQRLLDTHRLAPRVAIGTVTITAAVMVPAGWALVALILGCGAVALASHRSPLAGAGVIYAGLLPVSLAALRASDAYGLEAVLWLFAVVWGTDVMAYFGGRLIGGAKLWPRVSPSKTWSGFLTGVASGALAGLAVAWFCGRAHWALLPLGVVAGAAAQAGDLFESALKRRFGVKDSSRLIPGHGGVMDRLDGFLVATVLAAAFGSARFGADAAAGLLRW